MKTQKESTKKPITYVMTYRGVEDYDFGLHEGKNGRDVLIAGEEIPPANYDVTYKGRVEVGRKYLYGESEVSEEKASEVFKESEDKRSSLIDKIDEMYVYLGAKGAGPGFDYIRDVMKKNGKAKISIVACDCGFREKADFAIKNQLPIIWSDCGGRRTLSGLVKKALS
jgi:hypothetical protein